MAAGNDPVARGRRVHPCQADDRASQTEMSATVVVVVAAAAAAGVVVAHAAVTVPGNLLEAVGDTSLL